MQLQLQGYDMPEPGFHSSPGLPDRYEETPGEASPAWRRSLELNAHRRRN